MITLYADDAWVDLFFRLPFAFGVDYLTGTASKSAYWPTLPNNASIFDENLTWNLTFQYAHAIVIRMLLLFAGISSWMILKFFPPTQMVLSAIWLEIAAIFSLILALNIATLYMPYYTTFGIFILTQYLHSLFIFGIRKLRLLELMNLHSSLQYQSQNVEHLAETFLLILWPRFPIMVLLGRLTNDSSVGVIFYLATMTLLALPAMFFLLDALIWRGYSIFHTLRVRQSNDIHFVIISPYYVAVERCIWHSVGEEIVNRVYLLLWLSRASVLVGVTHYNHGLKDAYVTVPQALVDATCASFASMCGVAWMVAYLYEWLMGYWFKCIRVELAPEQNRDFRLMKYDLTSYLATFCYLGNMLDQSLPWTICHVIRMLFFFAIFRLTFLPYCCKLELQRQLLVGTANRTAYIRCGFDGAIFPLFLGAGLVSATWAMPFGLEKVFAAEWLTDKAKVFPADFELWMHGELVLALMDLFFMTFSASVTALAGHTHLIANGNAKLCHMILQNTEAMCKCYSNFVREFLSALLHSVVLATLWEERTGVLLSVTYMSRLMENMSALHESCLREFNPQFFCWSKCIIRALTSPDEYTFGEWKDVCSICQIEETTRENICSLPCNHFYHRECIGEWFKNQMRCPMCMRKLVFRNGEFDMDKLS